MILFLFLPDIGFAQSAGAIDLPETGQVTLQSPGDDGAVKAGIEWPAPRFVVNTDTGTVIDNLTGLMWLQNANCLGWSNGASYTTAKTNIDSFNISPASFSCGGNQTFGNWHLPTITQLLSLININQSPLDTWLNAQGFTGVIRDDYWSLTERSGSLPTSAWIVSMPNGSTVIKSKATTIDYVMAVRETDGDVPPPAPAPANVWQTQAGSFNYGEEWPTPRFVTNTDDPFVEEGTIKDNLTGLIWLENAGCLTPELPSVTWEEALKAVKNF